MSTKTDLYTSAEAAQILNKEISEKLTPESVTILAKDGKVQGIPEDGGYRFTKKGLVRFVVMWRVERSGSKRLSEKKRSQYLRRKRLAWWEAIFVFHGMEPSDQSEALAGFLFPKVVSMLWGAIDREEIGSHHKDGEANTPTDTRKNWQRWFREPGHIEEGWLDPVDRRSSFESALEQVTVVASLSSASSARKRAEYNEMAQALYRAMAENPTESIAHCAELASEALKTQQIHANPNSISRRTGKIDQSLLESLQAKLRAEKARSASKN